MIADNEASEEAARFTTTVYVLIVPSWAVTNTVNVADPPSGSVKLDDVLPESTLIAFTTTDETVDDVVGINEIEVTAFATEMEYDTVAALNVGLSEPWLG